jgi:hypothetical protein
MLSHAEHPPVNPQAITMQEIFNAKTPRRKGATIFIFMDLSCPLCVLAPWRLGVEF